MRLWEWVVLDVAVLLLLLLSLPVALVARRRWLTRSGGYFELSVNERGGEHPGGWTIGLGRYLRDDLEWYRFFSLSVRPKRVYTRTEVSVVERRQPAGAEVFALHSGHVVLRCAGPDGDFQLAMDPASVTALLAWLEAGPPGVDVSRVL